MNQVSTVGLDLAKYIFQLHGADSAGAVVRISLIPPGVSVHSAPCGGFTFADLSARCPSLGRLAVSDQGCRLGLRGSPVKPAAIRRRRTGSR